MKKILKFCLIIILSVLGIGIVALLFSPWYQHYIHSPFSVGSDYSMHLANLVQFAHFHPFPISAWQGMWFGGYPLLEGYPWLVYYLLVPFALAFHNAPIVMEYAAIGGLFVYIVVSFFLFWYVARNYCIALLFTTILLFSADSGMTLFASGFIVFVISQFLLPLTLLLVIAARKRESTRLLIFGAVTLAVAFYMHASMAGILILPAVIPFVFLNKNGQISTKTIREGILFFLIFGLLSTIQIYQYIGQALQGSDISSVIPTSFAELPKRFAFMLSWQNPVLLGVLVGSVVLFFARIKKDFVFLLPFLLSFLFIYGIFLLMVFKITSLVVILLAERSLWVITLLLLVFFAAQLSRAQTAKTRFLFEGIGLVLGIVYVIFLLQIKTPLLLPKTWNKYQENFLPVEYSMDPLFQKYRQKNMLPPLAWNTHFDNYRTDGLSFTIYAWWSLTSQNARFKGWYPAMRGLPLHWSGLVTAAELGRLGPKGTYASDAAALNQTQFFLDWYGIGHIQVGKNDPDLTPLLQKSPLITSSEQNGNLMYYSLNPKVVSPLYAPTNAKTIAIIAPEKEYNSVIETISMTGYSSQKLIPIYLGDSLAGLHKEDLADFDGVFLYGYTKPIWAIDSWSILSDFVKNGGNLFVETGQKVDETDSVNLPDVFPITKTQLEVVTKPWTAQLADSVLTRGMQQSDIAPLAYHYLPFGISAAPIDQVKTWARPVLEKDGETVVAKGEYGNGKVFWSGLNLPFQVLDTRNTSEVTLLKNTFDWFFPDAPAPAVLTTVTHPNFEHITVAGKGRGILIKEQDYPGWHATVNGVHAKIYKAGLYMMYLPTHTQNMFSAAISYAGDPLYWFFFWETLFVCFIVLLYLLFLEKIFTHPHVTRLRQKIKFKKPHMKSFLGGEDE